ncbi:lycopene cyclase domain-containing protein [Nakamurella flava]|uniref:Lycopene cyclase domain-containing protein n=1 Tax=Nakamurella flava TaxID=2576308 RepID=A0A4U6QBC2_9ACTN|nr:lycopene cyclase domain-containing protein [Nakamurella flava]TKV57334.1 lycopene cyclase domain-containing protein [Nakamurella flava]
MTGWTYLAVLAACVIGTLPLEFALRARVYRRWTGALLAVLPISAMFLTWDYFATAGGWWWFDENHLVGLWLAGMPLEEWLFFLVIPVCGLLTIEGVRHVRPDWGRAADAAGRPPIWSRPPSTVAPSQDVEASR